MRDEKTWRTSFGANQSLWWSLEGISKEEEGIEERERRKWRTEAFGFALVILVANDLERNEVEVEIMPIFLILSLFSWINCV